MKHYILSLSLTITLTSFTNIANAQQSLCSLDGGKVVSKLGLVSNNTTNIKTANKNLSGAAEIALAKHLKKINAKMYGAFWCPYCNQQKDMFGKEALTYITYIECDPRSQNSRRDLCQQAGIRSYPAWEINGRIYVGMRRLDDLANISGYQGRRDFKN
jgi:glutaredoxin